MWLSKFRVAIELAKGIKTLNELTRKYKVLPAKSVNGRDDR